jgi:hypothetical protein
MAIMTTSKTVVINLVVMIMSIERFKEMSLGCLRMSQVVTVKFRVVTMFVQ